MILIFIIDLALTYKQKSKFKQHVILIGINFL